ncbi:MAG TPA: glycoside hydrolase family 2 TIM barrel-domain containing protein [Pseudonocardiaceae bacterium]|nr:glycoside hydrolase family 2 TIM barrel-domain containing protein [Pseudonocardiaceae bacterium]
MSGARPQRWWRNMSRRRFLTATGIGAVGAVSLGSVMLTSNTDVASPPPTDQWLFGPYVDGCTDPSFDDAEMALVSVPHCVTSLSWQGWDPDSWQRVWVYRQHFDASPELHAARSFIRLDGVLSAAKVYLNGRLVGVHRGGYLPLTCELSGILSRSGNVIAVVVDGRWSQDVPPDLPDFAKPSAIDFYQPAGIYRPVTVYPEPKSFLRDVFAYPQDVLTADRSCPVQCLVDSNTKVSGKVSLVAELRQGTDLIASTSTEFDDLPHGQHTETLTLTGLSDVRLWDVDDPALCQVRVTLRIAGKQVDQRTVRIGFRDAQFTLDGFFLNGRRLKLFGLNRHQWFPYVGGAMPERVQRNDAEILKNELNCNMVRCSHYPQSPAFLDACDELGIMVWEEIPGWGHVGDNPWQQRVLEDVHDMVMRDRNRPSVIVWGTRVNETLGPVILYDRTDQLAQQLDPSRPTSGAVNGNLGYESPLYPGNTDSPFAFNDYSKPSTPHEQPGLRPPRPDTPYLVTEAIGALVGSPTYRRTDAVPIQAEQARLHAAVHDAAAADDRYCGLLAWAGFDYPSGSWHSVKGVKYPGVVDFFRIPKLGAAFYQSQVDPNVRTVIQPAFYWDIGTGPSAAGPGKDAVIWSNCEKVVCYLDGKKVATATPRRDLFPHLAYPPFLVDLTPPNGQRPDLRIDGYLGTNVVTSRQFSADPAFDSLYFQADDSEIVADGQDMTRVVVIAQDRYGSHRPGVTDPVTFAVDGPGELVGDNPLDFQAAGGAAAVWVRSVKDQPGTIGVSVAHPQLGQATVTIGSGTTPA